MPETVHQALAQLAEKFKDQRTQLFDVSVKELDDKNVSLTGRLLDDIHLDTLHRTFSERFPTLHLDTASINILRQPENRHLKVATNLTGLYGTPGFFNVLSGELVYGTELEVLEEREHWVFTRQNDGYLGWAYTRYLSAENQPAGTHLVTVPSIELYADHDLNSERVSRLMSGTAIHVEKSEKDWAYIHAHKSGWVPASALSAISQLPQAADERRTAILQLSRRMMGVPYLWGGCTGNGIDCSGFTRLLHHWVGIEIPRDADMQQAAARPVEPPFEPGDLLFFSEGQGSQRSITHVGISLGGWRMIHSSRSNNGVYIDNLQQNEFLRSIFVNAGAFIS